MNSTERKRTIKNLLQQNESVVVNELTRILGVSKVTVRADLDDLEQKGILVRTHGGAVLAENEDLVRMISNTLKEFTEEKRKIGAIAAQLVHNGQSIIIDSGSTTVHLARCISKTSLTVITNSVLVLHELMGSPQVDLLICGGVLRRPSMAIIGNIARNYFNQVHADILFLGASGFSLEQGVTCTNLIEADTKQAMIKNATQVCLMADSSKLGVVLLAKVCEWSAIDILITDWIPAQDRRALEALGVKVLTAIPEEPGGN